tara:strand:+ start:68 stop:694 length:627 start_codon:yes stop_codon:yes gene_type:complete
MTKNDSFKSYFISKANELLRKKEERNFEIDQHNRFAIDFFVAYFSDLELLKKLGGKIYKGLYLYGSAGTGKSLLFEILEDISKNQKSLSFRIKTIHTISLVNEVQQELSRPNQLAPNDSSIYLKNSRGPILFDDLGAERKLKHFGNTIDVMAEILQLRYFSLKNTTVKTFITSNLKPEEIRKEYGERVYDRFFEMFNFIEMSGEPRRK